MAFTASEITSLVEITGLSFAELNTVYAVGLDAAQEAAISADIELWEQSKNKFLKLEGGGKGIFLDSQDTVRAIKQRVFLQLGLTTGFNFGSAGMGSLQIG